MNRRDLLVATVGLLMAAGCTSTPDGSPQPASAMPSAAAAATSDAAPPTRDVPVETFGQNDNFAHASCVGPNAADTPASTVLAVAVCVNELLDDRQRTCAQTLAFDMLIDPIPRDPVLDALPQLTIDAADLGGFVPPSILREAEDLAGDGVITPIVSSFELDLLDGTSPSTIIQLQGPPLLTTNWSAIAVQYGLPGPPPEVGTFRVSQQVGSRIGLDIGMQYSLRGPTGAEQLTYAGSFDTGIGGAILLTLSDPDALRLIAGDAGYSSLAVWSEAFDVIDILEAEFGSDPTLRVRRPAAELEVIMTEQIDQLREAVALVRCMAPNARVDLGSSLADRDVTLEEADCLLAAFAEDPLDQAVIERNESC